MEKTAKLDIIIDLRNSLDTESNLHILWILFFQWKLDYLYKFKLAFCIGKIKFAFLRIQVCLSENSSLKQVCVSENSSLKQVCVSENSSLLERIKFVVYENSTFHPKNQVAVNRCELRRTR